MTLSEAIAAILQDGLEIKLRQSRTGTYAVRISTGEMVASGSISRQRMQDEGADAVIELLTDLHRMIKEDI